MKKALLLLLVVFNRVFPHDPGEGTAGYEVRLHSVVPKNNKKEVTYSLWDNGDSPIAWLLIGPQKKATFTGVFEDKNENPFFVVTSVEINRTPFSVDKHGPIFASLLQSSIRINGVVCVYGGKEKSD